MHPALAPEELAARKAELCAEAGKLRREFCDQAAELESIAQAAQFGFDAVQAFKKTDVVVPPALGATIGIAVEHVFPALNGWGRFLRDGAIVARVWTVLRAFEGMGLPKETAAPK